jgi:hypothetical protein
MTTVPAGKLKRGDRIRVNNGSFKLTGVLTKDGIVYARGPGHMRFRWPVDYQVEIEVDAS